MPPSAELKDAQFDPMKWFYHDYLIEHLGTDLSLRSFMESYADGSIWKQDIARWMKYYHLDVCINEHWPIRGKRRCVRTAMCLKS